jgi:SAM-dependent methyltransferase
MVRLLSRLRQYAVQRPFNRLSREAVFDKIYLDGTWGKDSDSRPFSGAGSRDERIVAPYVEAVQSFLDSLGDASVVDLGCGDFTVGSRLNAASYIGCDISEVVLEHNRSRYEGTEFLRLDVAEDDLPVGDVGILRQVLQHLDNESIAKFVEKLAPRPYKYLIVTESEPSGGRFTANLDKPTGPGIRLQQNSAIVLTAPPFCLRPTAEKVLCAVETPHGRHPQLVKTTCYSFGVELPA